MTQQAREHRPLGPARIEALAHAALDAFAERLKSAAEADDGVLTPEDIDNLAAAFKADPDGRLAQGSRQLWETCVSHARWAIHERRRDNPIVRILVDRFSHLLAPEGVEPDADGRLSRRMIPGFRHALDLMIGPDPFDAYQHHGRNIVARLREQRDDDFRWHDVYRDAEATWLANDALMQIIGYFEDMPKRRNWMIDVVDRHLRPLPVTTGTGITDRVAWRFGEAEFREMMRALYADLKDRLDDDGGRRGLVARYGEDGGTCLARLLRDLDRDAGEAGASPPPATRPAYAAKTGNPH